MNKQRFSFFDGVIISDQVRMYIGMRHAIEGAKAPGALFTLLIL